MAGDLGDPKNMPNAYLAHARGGENWVAGSIDFIAKSTSTTVALYGYLPKAMLDARGGQYPKYIGLDDVYVFELPFPAWLLGQIGRLFGA